MTVGAALGGVLRAERDQLNARFSTAQAAYPHLDPGRFAQFLVRCVDPLATEVARVRPGDLGTVVLAAYDVGLDLAGKGLTEAVEAGLAAVGAAAAPMVASAPRPVLARVANALLQLARCPGARPEAWVDIMGRVAPRCGDVETFLRAGMVSGWVAGLAHHRTSALEIADQLPEALAQEILGARHPWPALRGRLAEDPWVAPDGRTVPPIRVAGAFRGFGGLFIAPPTVARRGQAFVVESGDDAWLLTTDVFGTTFHRATAAERAEPLVPAPGRITSAGALVMGARTWRLPVSGPVTSVAADATTALVTSALGHGVTIVALTVAG